MTPYSFLVTGSSGFIGSHIVEHALQAGHRVVGLDLYPSSLFENEKQFSFIQGSILDEAICHRACQNIDFISHHAALTSVPESFEKEDLYYQTNVIGTQHIVRAAQANGVKRIIFASSAAVYGYADGSDKTRLTEDHPLLPQSPYAAFKACSEKDLEQASRESQLCTCSLRYFNVYGPRQKPDSIYSGAISKYINAFLQHKPVTVFGDGQQTRDFVYVEDIAKINLSICLSSHRYRGQALNVATGVSVSLNDLIASLTQITGSPVPILFEDQRKGDIRYSLANNEALQENLGCLHPFTSLIDGLKETITSFYLY